MMWLAVSVRWPAFMICIIRSLPRAGKLARLFGLSAAFVGFLLLPRPARPAEQATGVDEARQGLRREGFSWYDKKEDTARPVHVDVPWNVGNAPKSNWRFSLWGISVWEILAITGLVVVLAIIVWLLIRTYLNREDNVATIESGRMRQAAVDDKARIEALPFRIRRGDIDLLAEARRLYEEGQYSEAIVYLFSYQLVEMDRHQVIRLAKGKTNRQYLRDLRRQPMLQEIIERSMVAFEEVFFGGHTLDRARFENVWRQLGQFTAFVMQQGAA
jgi:hypothetical protein